MPQAARQRTRNCARKPLGDPETLVIGITEEDVVSALVNLGYQRPAAERALAMAGKNKEEATFEALFRNTLAALAK
jgi:Holliday junction resolvasome RuvABC DNA-binding subunit